MKDTHFHFNNNHELFFSGPLVNQSDWLFGKFRQINSWTDKTTVMLIFDFTGWRPSVFRVLEELTIRLAVCASLSVSPSVLSFFLFLDDLMARGCFRLDWDVVEPLEVEKIFSNFFELYETLPLFDSTGRNITNWRSINFSFSTRNKTRS